MVFTMNQELTYVTKWIKSNKLAINIEKTYYMISHHSDHRADVNIFMNNSRLERVDKAKFLGVVLDSKLTWKSHNRYIRTDVSKVAGILYKDNYISP